MPLLESVQAIARTGLHYATDTYDRERYDRLLELVDVFTRLPHRDYSPYTLVSVVYLCEIVGGTLRSSQEDLGLEYWFIDDVSVWHGHQEAQARRAHASWLRRQESQQEQENKVDRASA